MLHRKFFSFRLVSWRSCSFRVGLDNVDIKAATNAGVMVVNAPTSNVVSAAELAIGHLLSLSRHIPDAKYIRKLWVDPLISHFVLTPT